MENQIIQADKKLRKQVLVGICIFILVSGLLIHMMLAYLQECKSLAETDAVMAISNISHLVTIITIANAFVSSVFALYVFSVATKVLKSGRFPPEGMKVIKDTRLLTGRKAKRMAMGHILIGIVLLSTNALMGYLHLILDTLAK